jgi:hypothetical protein
MSAAVTPSVRWRLMVGLGVMLGVIVVAAANWHLVRVATSSEPDCLAHVRLGEGDGKRGLYGAAESSCDANGETKQ